MNENESTQEIANDINDIYGSQKYKLLRLALVLYVFFIFFNATPMSVANVFFKLLCWGSLFASSLILFAIWFIYSNHSFWDYIITIIITALSLYFLFIYNNKTILPSVSLLFALKAQFHFDYVLKRICILGCICCLFVFFCYIVGLSEDHVVLRDNLSIGSLELQNHSYGFWYYSTPAYFFMTLVNVGLYYKRKTCTISFLLLMIVLSFGIFYIFVTRLQLLCNLSLILAIIIVYKIRLISVTSILWKYLGLCLYPGFMLLMWYVFSSDEITTSDWFIASDIVLNGRLSINVDSFKEYPVNLLGNFIEYSEGNILEDYFYIDSGYVFSLLNCGWVFTLYLVISYSFLFVKIYEAKEAFLYLWLFFFGILNLFNNFLLSPVFFPLILLLYDRSSLDQYSRI